MADQIRMSARRRFWLTPQRRPFVGDVFYVSPRLAERLVQRGDAEHAPAPMLEPEPVRLRRKRKKPAL